MKEFFKNTKSLLAAQFQHVGAVFVAIFQLICVLVAEVSLGSFLPDPSPLPRIARVLALFLAIYVIHRFAKRCLSGYRSKETKDLLSAYAIFAFVILLLGLGKVLSLGFAGYVVQHGVLSEFNAETLFFSLPFPVLVVLVQAVLGAHVSLIIGLQLSLFVTAYHPEQSLALPYLLATSLVAVLSFLKFRTRAAFLRVGLNVALVSLPFSIGDLLIDGDMRWTTIVSQLAGALLCGTVTAFVAAGLTPLIEHVGGYATDMRLIEMATLDHSLLKELSIQAPGTWNHSMVMGMMVESAADSIGANSVVCRVGAYFHDVGKVKKPLYFVENQPPGENRHDKLSPSMSALIIRSHVKDGMELARKHGIPQVITEMIPQHHGTSLIEYFYDKARTEAEDNGDDPESVDRSLYTYPGPRPQTKEAGILMLADGIEAAARTLSDPTFDRIQGMVQKMINKVFASGELNECELTLTDLHAIAKCFTRVLSGIYHQRIAYAEPVEKGSERTSSKTVREEDGADSSSAESAGSNQSRKQKASSDERPGKEESKEDLKRLGL